MLKITKTFKDFEGNERTLDMRFNLTKAELIEMNMEVEGGLQKELEKIVQTYDSNKLLKFFKDLVLRSYGEISPDGMRFIKNDTIRENFSQTQVYSDLFCELAEDADKAAAFVNGIIPEDLLPYPTYSKILFYV